MFLTCHYFSKANNIILLIDSDIQAFYLSLGDTVSDVFVLFSVLLFDDGLFVSPHPTSVAIIRDSVMTDNSLVILFVF